MILYVHAVARELGGLGPKLAPAQTLQLGVGKAAATARLARRLAAGDVQRVVALGVAGALPPALAQQSGSEAVGVGRVCLVRSDRLADEGVAIPGSFLDLEALALEDEDPAVRGPWTWDAALGEDLAQTLGLHVVEGRTVSTCSGSDGLALARTRGPAAELETMEGAAVALCCAMWGVPWIAVRAVSNYTGDRTQAQWDLDGALAALHPAVLRLHRELHAA